MWLTDYWICYTPHSKKHFFFFARGGRCQNHFLILAELGSMEVINCDDMLIFLHWYTKLGFDPSKVLGKCFYCLRHTKKFSRRREPIWQRGLVALYLWGPWKPWTREGGPCVLRCKSMMQRACALCLMKHKHTRRWHGAVLSYKGMFC
jgi:hypothetical protein